MDVAWGFPKENLKLKQEFVMGSLWIWEFFVKALAYFFYCKILQKAKRARESFGRKPGSTERTAGKRN